MKKKSKVPLMIGGGADEYISFKLFEPPLLDLMYGLRLQGYTAQYDSALTDSGIELLVRTALYSPIIAFLQAHQQKDERAAKRLRKKIKKLSELSSTSTEAG